jgi:hypothetical protein
VQLNTQLKLLGITDRDERRARVEAELAPGASFDLLPLQEQARVLVVVLDKAKADMLAREDDDSTPENENEGDVGTASD